MTKSNIKFILVALFAPLLFVQCNNDDDTVDPPAGNDFSGTYAQQDIMGRPGINTVFGSSEAVKNSYNVSIPSNRESFQPGFEAMLEAYHDAFGATLDYEANILGLDAATFTTVLAQFDALQIAPDGPTTYYNGTQVLTGRTLSDDVIDVSLILMFGGATGDRFDGDNGTPELVTDNVGAGDRVFENVFPYMEAPNM
jgi:hypothetical protein